MQATQSLPTAKHAHLRDGAFDDLADDTAHANVSVHKNALFAIAGTAAR